MKIKILKSIASVTWSYRKGQIVEIDDAEAIRWLNAKIAEAVKEPAKPNKPAKPEMQPVVETASTEVVTEKAVSPKKVK